RRALSHGPTTAATPACTWPRRWARRARSSRRWWRRPRRACATPRSASTWAVMQHTAHGYWLEEAGAVDAAPPLSADVSADVVVIGGGYAGVWAPWALRGRG